jgi:UTP:GlnB (protein PII) uridylyltransferase
VATPSAIALLSEDSGVDLSLLAEAEDRSEEMLGRLKGIAERVDAPSDGCFVAMGSVGRREVTSGSDADDAFVVQRPDSLIPLLRCVEFPAADLAGFL